MAAGQACCYVIKYLLRKYRAMGPFNYLSGPKGPTDVVPHLHYIARYARCIISKLIMMQMGFVKGKVSYEI